MKKLRDYLNEGKSTINEASLSRVYQHFNSDRPIGIITAFRGDLPYDENVKNNQKLAQKVKEKGYGFIWVDGAWIENEGTDEERHVKEISLFIVGKSDGEAADDMESFLITQAKEYDQDAFVIKKANERTVYLLDQNGNEIKELKNAKFDQTAIMYTSLRNGSQVGRSFVLEGRKADSFSSKLIENYKK